MAKNIVQEIRRKTRRHFSAEEKIRRRPRVQIMRLLESLSSQHR